MIQEKDLNYELAALQRLFRQRNEDVINGSAAERSAATPQLVALADKISALVKAQHQLGVETNEVLEKTTVMTLASDIVRIIQEEMTHLPNTDTWVQDVAGITRSPEVTAAFAGWLDQYEDKYVVSERFAQRILELAVAVENDA